MLVYKQKSHTNGTAPAHATVMASGNAFHCLHFLRLMEDETD